MPLFYAFLFTFFTPFVLCSSEITSIKKLTRLIKVTKKGTRRALDARFKRAYLYLQKGMWKRCSHDLSYLERYDPHWPKVTYNGPFITIHNLQLDFSKREVVEAFKEFYIKLGICSSKDDMQIFFDRTVVIKAERRCVPLVIMQSSLSLVTNNPRLVEEEQQIKECKRKCEVANLAATTLCGGLASRGGNKAIAACIAALKILTDQCNDCCDEGFNECFKKVEVFTDGFLDKLLPKDNSILD